MRKDLKWIMHVGDVAYNLLILFNTKLITEGQFEMSLGIDLPVSILFSITISFILMALYNIQDYIENPFDQKGLDDLQIDQMQIFEKESLYE